MHYTKPSIGPFTRALALTLAAGAALIASYAAPAAAQGDPVKELAAPPPVVLPLKPDPAFAKFPAYEGTLGQRHIVLRLGAKTGEDAASGVHGEYQFADTGQVVLVAGDRENATLEIEESTDGTHITGNWVGQFGADGALSGQRMNVDDSNPQPFDLHPVPAAGGAAPAAGVPAGNGAAAWSGRPQGGQAVDGVSNLRTGE